MELETPGKWVKAKPKKFRNVQLHLYTDNTVALSYFQKGGGRVPHLMQIFREFLEMAWKLNLIIRRATYLPSKENVEADLLSRVLALPHEAEPSSVEMQHKIKQALVVINKNVNKIVRRNEQLQDWRLSSSSFQELVSKMGPLEVDRFATA